MFIPFGTVIEDKEDILKFIPKKAMNISINENTNVGNYSIDYSLFGFGSIDTRDYSVFLDDNKKVVNVMRFN